MLYKLPGAISALDMNVYWPRIQQFATSERFLEDLIKRHSLRVDRSDARSRVRFRSELLAGLRYLPMRSSQLRSSEYCCFHISYSSESAETTEGVTRDLVKRILDSSFDIRL